MLEGQDWKPKYFFVGAADIRLKLTTSHIPFMASTMMIVVRSSECFLTPPR